MQMNTKSKVRFSQVVRVLGSTGDPAQARGLEGEGEASGQRTRQTAEQG